MKYILSDCEVVRRYNLKRDIIRCERNIRYNLYNKYSLYNINMLHDVFLKDWVVNFHLTIL